MSHCKLIVKGGGNPVDLFDKVKQAVKPTDADMLHAGNLLKTRILQRTAAGVDASGASFAPYSTKGPYYYYPFAKTGGKTSFSGKQKQSAAHRLQKKIGGKLSKSGHGIRFESYAAFKSALGRAGGVDLYGLRAPHMLQAIQVQVRGAVIVVGIYGEEAERASGHNTGIPGRLPQRRFFDHNAQDLAVMLADLQQNAVKRAQQVLK